MPISQRPPPGSVAPNLIWGPYGGGQRHGVPSALQTCISGSLRTLALRTGLGMAPKSSLGRRKGAVWRGWGGLFFPVIPAPERKSPPLHLKRATTAGDLCERALDLVTSGPGVAPSRRRQQPELGIGGCPRSALGPGASWGLSLALSEALSFPPPSGNRLLPTAPSRRCSFPHLAARLIREWRRCKLTSAGNSAWRAAAADASAAQDCMSAVGVRPRRSTRPFVYSRYIFNPHLAVPPLRLRRTRLPTSAAPAAPISVIPALAAEPALDLIGGISPRTTPTPRIQQLQMYHAQRVTPPKRLCYASPSPASGACNARTSPSIDPGSPIRRDSSTAPSSSIRRACGSTRA